MKSVFLVLILSMLLIGCRVLEAERYEDLPQNDKGGRVINQTCGGEVSLGNSEKEALCFQKEI